MFLQFLDITIILFTFLTVDDFSREPCPNFLDWSVFSKEQKVYVVCTGKCHQCLGNINLLTPH